MTNRIIEAGEKVVKLYSKNNLLHIKLIGNQIHTVPFRDIGVLILSNPIVVLTQQAITGIIEGGGMVTICGTNYLPQGMFLPVSSNVNSARNFEIQVKVTLPVKKNIWKHVVRTKIKFQAELLKHIYEDDFGLSKMSLRVHSGDPENVEAQASQKYWKLLFNQHDFRRNRTFLDQNRYLNYGYTILRACTARAICGAGLHPSFGIHHHNQYNPFRLADDLMEPYRPLVDNTVVNMLNEVDEKTEMSKEIKKSILSFTEHSLLLDGEEVSLFTSLTRLAVSLLDVFTKKRKKIILPQSLLP